MRKIILASVLILVLLIGVLHAQEQQQVQPQVQQQQQQQPVPQQQQQAIVKNIDAPAIVLKPKVTLPIVRTQPVQQATDVVPVETPQQQQPIKSQVQNTPQIVTTPVRQSSIRNFYSFVLASPLQRRRRRGYKTLSGKVECFAWDCIRRPHGHHEEVKEMDGTATVLAAVPVLAKTNGLCFPWEACWRRGHGYNDEELIKSDEQSLQQVAVLSKSNTLMAASCPAWLCGRRPHGHHDDASSMEGATVLAVPVRRFSNGRKRKSSNTFSILKLN
jgi:hypothetical protein